MATSKSLRAAPERKLKDYVASIKYLSGPPDSIPDSLFTDFYEDDAGGPAGVTVPLGFYFPINNGNNLVQYEEIILFSKGLFFFREPHAGTGQFPDVGGTNSEENYSLLTSFLAEHLVVAPWWMGPTNNKPVRNYLDPSITSLYGLSTEAIEQLKLGYYFGKIPYDLVDYGIRTKNAYHPSKGRCLHIRWSLTDFVFIYKFESVIFENGTIELRYWPLIRLLQTATPSSKNGYVSGSVGVFASARNFRDLTGLFSYRKEDRTTAERGGAEYEFGYTDSYGDGSQTSMYTISIDANYWPKNGAIITLSPPTNPTKFLPRKTAKDISNAKELVPAGGLFDDRKTIGYFTSSIQVHMPSTLPSRIQGDSGDINITARQLLFTSGSIVTAGSVDVHAIDGLLMQLDAMEKSGKTFDNSFNEVQKNYDAIVEASPFYATGSSVELFGPGFDAPLSSKTQFVFSLPVVNTTKLPPLTSSFHCYDTNEKRWMMMDQDGYNQPWPWYVRSVPPIDPAKESEANAYHRVTETSRGFDAVGRKVISGSRILYSPTDTNLQTDLVIGSIFNQPSGSSGELQNIIDSALTKGYSKSVTDNPNFYPSKNQQVNFDVEYPFLIEKIVAEIPVSVSGSWFNDVTTCNRAFGLETPCSGVASGAMDFGGPGLTFAVWCPRKAPGVSYMDLIASGTITHNFDDKAEVVLKKDPGMNFYSLRPVGFKSFSNPSAVISGTLQGSMYKFEGTVVLELEAAIAGGISFARNDRSLVNSTASDVSTNRRKAIELLTQNSLSTRGESDYNSYYDSGDPAYSGFYFARSPRVHIQQVSPLSRGTSKFEFNGNSILGGAIAYSNTETTITNPLYVSRSGSLPNAYKTAIDSAGFNFDAVSAYSTVDSRPSPYLIFPGDKLMFTISKTRPVIYKANKYDDGVTTYFGKYTLTGSHDSFLLNTGSIDVTIYGSYVREGMGYNP